MVCGAVVNAPGIGWLGSVVVPGVVFPCSACLSHLARASAFLLWSLSVALSVRLTFPLYALRHVRQIICGHFNDSNGQQIFNFRLFFFCLK